MPCDQYHLFVKYKEELDSWVVDNLEPLEAMRRRHRTQSAEPFPFTNSNHVTVKEEMAGLYRRDFQLDYLHQIVVELSESETGRIGVTIGERNREGEPCREWMKVNPLNMMPPAQSNVIHLTNSEVNEILCHRINEEESGTALVSTRSDSLPHSMEDCQTQTHLEHFNQHDERKQVVFDNEMPSFNGEQSTHREVSPMVDNSRKSHVLEPRVVLESSAEDIIAPIEIEEEELIEESNSVAGFDLNPTADIKNDSDEGAYSDRECAIQISEIQPTSPSVQLNPIEPLLNREEDIPDNTGERERQISIEHGSEQKIQRNETDYRDQVHDEVNSECELNVDHSSLILDQEVLFSRDSLSPSPSSPYLEHEPICFTAHNSETDHPIKGEQGDTSAVEQSQKLVPDVRRMIKRRHKWNPPRIVDMDRFLHWRQIPVINRSNNRIRADHPFAEVTRVRKNRSK